MIGYSHSNYTNRIEFPLIVDICDGISTQTFVELAPGVGYKLGFHFVSKEPGYSTTWIAFGCKFTPRVQRIVVQFIFGVIQFLFDPLQMNVCKW